MLDCIFLMLCAKEEERIEMNDFIRCITKFAVLCAISVALLLLVLAGMLLFYPKVLLKALYLIAVIACLGGALYIIIGLIATAILCQIAKKRCCRR